MGVTLVEVFEPVFQHACRLNRLGRKGGVADMGQVRAELKGLLADAKARAERAGLGSWHAEVEPAVVYFLDFMVKEGKQPWAASWNDLAYERGRRSGYSDFFNMLDEALADPREGATEKIAVFFTCVGLGFTGMHHGEPEVLKRKMLEMAARLRGTMDTDLGQRLTPGAYEQTNRKPLEIETAPTLVGLGIAAALMVVGVVVANVLSYGWATEKPARVVEALSGAGGR